MASVSKFWRSMMSLIGNVSLICGTKAIRVWDRTRPLQQRTRSQAKNSMPSIDLSLVRCLVFNEASCSGTQHLTMFGLWSKTQLDASQQPCNGLEPSQPHVLGLRPYSASLIYTRMYELIGMRRHCKTVPAMSYMPQNAVQHVYRM
jgi:hypothetical protein